MEYLLFILALLFGLGAIADRVQETRNNCTLMCVACIVAIVILRTF